MGWAHGQAADGRDIGYGVQAKCDFPGCDMQIDRGLAYCCGSMHESGNNDGCGKYFCGKHRDKIVHECDWQDDDDEAVYFERPSELQSIPGVGAIILKSDPLEITSFYVGNDLMIGIRLVAERFHARLEGVDRNIMPNINGVLLSSLLPNPKYVWRFCGMNRFEFWPEREVDIAIQKAFDDLQIDVPVWASQRTTLALFSEGFPVG